MKNVFRLLASATKYRASITMHLLFVILNTVFSLVSFAAIAPFLSILFNTTSTAVSAAPEPAFSSEYAFGIVNYYLATYIAAYGKADALLWFCVFLIFIFFLKNLSQYLALFFQANFRTGIVRDIRKNIYDKILVLPIAHFTEERKGDIISRATNDVNEVENSIMSTLELLFRSPIKILLSLGTLVFMSWKLTTAVLIILPIAGYFISLLGKSIKKNSSKNQEYLAEVLSLFEETISSIKVIKAFNAQGQLEKSFRDQNNAQNKINRQIVKRQYSSSPLSELIATLLIALLLYIGGNMVLNNEGALSGEFFIAYIVMFSQLIPPAKALSQATFKIQRGIASADRIDEILSEEDPIKEIESPKRIDEFKHSIEFKNASFKYKDNWVLDDINLTIKKGETIAIVGASGGGKSTLANLIPRFYDPQNGSIEVDGEKLKNYRINDLRGLIGIVTQESLLFNDTVRKNIALGDNNGDLNRIKESAETAYASEFIDKLPERYDFVIGERGGKLSGGQRQRLSIARALYKNPPILILDEATSALDTESEKMVQEAITNLMKNRTSLVIAHRLSTIKNADKIIVIEGGKIVESGKHDELLNANGTYKKLYDLQSFS